MPMLYAVCAASVACALSLYRLYNSIFFLTLRPLSVAHLCLFYIFICVPDCLALALWIVHGYVLQESEWYR